MAPCISVIETEGNLVEGVAVSLALLHDEHDHVNS